MKEKDGFGSLQGIKMFLVTPTPKDLPERRNVNYTLRKILKKLLLIQKQNRGKYVSKYSVYYDWNVIF